MQEIRKKARERVKARCKVCPVCNGVACAGEVPGMGGIGTGVSFRNNIEALGNHQLVLRTLHAANNPDPTLELWGRKLSLPVLSAPVGSVALNLGSDMSDTRYTQLALLGCRAAGTLTGIGDLPMKENFQKYMEIAAEAPKFAIPFIKPWSKTEEVSLRMDMALRAGVDICGMDVDGAGLPTLRNAPVPVSTKTPAELEKIISAAHERKMKFIVKGIMSTDEALLAADLGADAIVVSNHGGRVLDHGPGTADVLPAIAEVVGKRLVVMVDGGIRSGADVLKALALGAHLTLICRPIMIAIHGDEENGLPKYLGLIRDQLVQAMRLTGCADLKSISPNVLF